MFNGLVYPCLIPPEGTIHNLAEYKLKKNYIHLLLYIMNIIIRILMGIFEFAEFSLHTGKSMFVNKTKQLSRILHEIAIGKKLLQ